MSTITPLQAAGPKRAHLHSEQVPTGKELSGESLQHSASSVTVRQNTTLALCCCVDSLAGWHWKNKRGTSPKRRLKHTESELRHNKLDTDCPITTNMSCYIFMICALVLLKIEAHLFPYIQYICVLYIYISLRVLIDLISNFTIYFLYR